MRIAVFLLSMALGIGALAPGVHAFSLTVRQLPHARRDAALATRPQAARPFTPSSFALAEIGRGYRHAYAHEFRDWTDRIARERAFTGSRADAGRAKVAKLEQERVVALALFVSLGAMAITGIVLSTRRRAVAPAGARGALPPAPASAPGHRAPARAVEILRPGPARSRLETDMWLRWTSCRCGGGLVCYWEGLPRTPGPEVWESDVSCSRCGTLHRCLFEAGPGWLLGRHRGEGVGERPSLDARLALTAAPSEILTETMLRAELARAVETLDIGCPAGALEDLIDSDWRFGALDGGGQVLQSLIELEKLTTVGRATLAAGDRALRERATRVFTLAGGVPPPPPPAPPRPPPAPSADLAISPTA